jgi:hypothetical protein
LTRSSDARTIEELTKAILEGGLLRESHDRYELDGPVPGLAISATLHASLLARLDRLRSVKDVVQISVVGREFSDMAGGMGSRLLRPVQLAMPAMAHAKTGEIEQCLRLSEEAFCTAEQSGEMQAAASLLRAYAEALFSRGRLNEAKHQFNRGLKIAEAQGAKFEERQLKARIASLFP